jgi:hypothetical protein
MERHGCKFQWPKEIWSPNDARKACIGIVDSSPRILRETPIDSILHDGGNIDHQAGAILSPPEIPQDPYFFRGTFMITGVSAEVLGNYMFKIIDQIGDSVFLVTVNVEQYTGVLFRGTASTWPVCITEGRERNHTAISVIDYMQDFDGGIQYFHPTKIVDYLTMQAIVGDLIKSTGASCVYLVIALYPALKVLYFPSASVITTLCSEGLPYIGDKQLQRAVSELLSAEATEVAVTPPATFVGDDIDAAIADVTMNATSLDAIFEPQNILAGDNEQQPVRRRRYAQYKRPRTRLDDNTHWRHRAEQFVILPENAMFDATFVAQPINLFKAACKKLSPEQAMLAKSCRREAQNRFAYQTLCARDSHEFLQLRMEAETLAAENAELQQKITAFAEKHSRP